MINPDISSFLDGLPFPMLASSLIQGALFTSSKVMYANRPLLDIFSTTKAPMESLSTEKKYRVVPF